jgi:hypothetical protein
MTTPVRNQNLGNPPAITPLIHHLHTKNFLLVLDNCEHHVGSILSKLGFHSRTQIAVWAIEKGLVQDPR